MRLKRRNFLPGDYLIKQGTMPEGMFFITSHPGVPRGEVEILQREELQDAVDTYKRIPFKGGEKIVGEISLLRDTKATAFVRAKTVCGTELLLKAALAPFRRPLSAARLTQCARLHWEACHIQCGTLLAGVGPQMTSYDRCQPRQ